MMFTKLFKHPLTSVVLSIFISVYIIYLVRFDFNNLLRPEIPFIASLSIMRLMLQGLRFHILVKSFTHVSAGFFTSFAVRAGSEFLALSTIPFIADEAGRTIWLVSKGVKTGKAFWIAFLELVMDSLLVSSLALAASVRAFQTGAGNLALFLLLINIPIIITYSLSLWIFRTNKLQALSKFFKVVEWFAAATTAGRFRKAFETQLNILSESVNSSITRKGLTSLVVCGVVSLGVALSSAVVIWFLTQNYAVTLFDSVMAYATSTTFGIIPISPGGAGLSELGMFLYMSDVVGIPSWQHVIEWRIITYHLTLIVTSFFTILLTTRKI